MYVINIKPYFISGFGNRQAKKTLSRVTSRTETMYSYKSVNPRNLVVSTFSALGLQTDAITPDFFFFFFQIWFWELNLRFHDSEASTLFFFTEPSL